jgi:hypothetical protein
MATIFRWATCEQMSLGYPPHIEAHLPWANVYSRAAEISLVSSYFRRIALGTPSLWTTLPVSSMKDADLIARAFERSYATPLSIVTYHASIMHTPSLMAKLKSGTLRDLWLVGFQELQETQDLGWMAPLNSAESLLESLHVNWIGGSPDIFLPLQAPRLSTLSLDSNTGSWPKMIPTMSSLTTLILNVVWFVPTDIPRIIDLVLHSPSLTQFIFSTPTSTQARRQDEWSDLPDPVSPRALYDIRPCPQSLRDILVFGDPLVAAFMLQTLSPSPLAEIRVQIYDGLSDDAVVALSNYMRLREGPRRATLRSKSSRHLRGFEIQFYGFGPYPSVSVWLSIVSWDKIDALMNTIMPLIRWEDLEEVEIQGIDSGVVPDKLWASLRDSQTLHSVAHLRWRDADE